VFRRFFTSLSFTAIIFALNLVSGVVVARALGPDGRGVLAIVMSWPVLISGIFHFSIGDTAAYFSSIENNTANTYSKSDILYFTFFYSTLTSLIGTLALLFFINFLFPVDAYSRQIINTFMFALTILNHFSLSCVGFLRGSTEIKKWNLVRLLPHLGYALGCSLLWFSAVNHVELYALSMLFANLLTTSLGVIFVSGKFNLYRTPSLKNSRSYLKYALSLHIPRLVSMFRSQADKIFLSFLVPVSDVGIYVVAYTVSFLLMMLNDTFFSLLQPICAQMLNNSRPDARYDFIRLALASLIILVLSAFSLMIVSPYLISIAFGGEYDLAVSMTYFLIPAALLASISKLGEVIFVSANKNGLLAVSEFAWVVAFFTLTFFVKPDTGLQMSFIILASNGIMALFTVANAVRIFSPFLTLR
jgi:O-antigen/teichoic acid export membrane protein